MRNIIIDGNNRNKRRMIWVGHLACMREKRGVNGYWQENLKERDKGGVAFVRVDKPNPSTRCSPLGWRKTLKEMQTQIGTVKSWRRTI
jgi:hypothetical protein